MKTTQAHPIIKVALFACFLGFIGLFGSDIYLPAMPSMQLYFHTTVTNIELSIALYMAGFALSPLLYGPLSDAHGRKPIIITGLAIATFGTLMIIFSHHINMFLTGRVIQGIGAGATLSMFRVLMRDVVKGKQMATLSSYTTMLFNLSPIIGLILGGYIAHYLNWQLCFWLLVVIYIGFMLIFGLTCPETLGQPTPFKPAHALKHYGDALSHRMLILNALCAGCSFSIVFGFITAGSFIFQHHFHLSALTFGWLGGLIGLAFIIGKLFNAYTAKRIALKFTMLSGMIMIIIFGSLLLMINNTVITAIAGVFIISGCTGLINSNAMSRAMHSYHKQIGYAASIYSAIQVTTGFITNSILAHYHQLGLQGLSIFYITLGIIALILLLFTMKETV
jgi:Bcr/CflA subfamily drug resistance transporter